MLQVGVKSSGYETNNTFLEPLKSDRETVVSRWVSNVKSGAVAPASISAMNGTSSFEINGDLVVDNRASLQDRITFVLV
jgi:hypothetical protein